ncbi:MAG: 16S rRNA (uracil(1498)-N(3))-methyltransferase [Fibromonadaceae bacterium]|jgi:16S rRNA (uracil1498-N3)-methyltransferase|nr:16S rRNA (uracil(1498)-N(3))-methyltransferase [Fibromonadaceae bacterium]
MSANSNPSFFVVGSTPARKGSEQPKAGNPSPLDSNFFLENLELGEAILSQGESTHIIKAFRAKTGACLELCDGKGRFAKAELLEANPKACRVLIKSISEQEPPPQLHLAISCLTDGGEEEITFHAAQLPLAAIHLLRTEKSLEPRNSDLGKLRRRMEAKSLAALKQSRKSWLTEIKAPIKLNDFLENFKGTLIACEKNLQSPNALNLQSPTAILTGPEGGFSPAELEMLKNKNAHFLSLGNTRLRATTAPIIALAKFVH